MSPNAAPTDPAVTRFLDAVWMERGLSPNTLAAYRALLLNPAVLRSADFRYTRDLLPGRYPIWKFLSGVKRRLGFTPRR